MIGRREGLGHPGVLEDLARFGAVVVEGVEAPEPGDLARVRAGLRWKAFSYAGGNSPRTLLADGVYTVTEFPPSAPISLHNELSYASRWPKALLIHCLQPAPAGGESLLASNAELTARLPEKTKERFRAGVVYVHTMEESPALGSSWRKVFPGMERSEIDRWCAAASVEHEWTAAGALRIVYRQPAFRSLAGGGDPVWFCQVDQWHPSALPAEAIAAAERLGLELPHRSYFADGSEIPGELVQEIQQTFRASALEVALGPNELLLVDNERIAHGRNPFSGLRNVRIALAAY